MNDISVAAEKLVQLIRRHFDEGYVAPWGMQEYDYYESKYLDPLEKSEQVEVFKSAYSTITPEEIKSFFYLASVYAVPLHNEYFEIFKNEKDESKKKAFFIKMKYYIDDRWSEKRKNELTQEEKDLLAFYSEKYGLKET